MTWGRERQLGPASRQVGLWPPTPRVGKNGEQDRPQAGAKRGEGQKRKHARRPLSSLPAGRASSGDPSGPWTDPDTSYGRIGTLKAEFSR